MKLAFVYSAERTARGALMNPRQMTSRYSRFRRVLGSVAVVGASVFLIGCVSVGNLATGLPSATPDLGAIGTAPVATPERTRRPCSSGDTRPRCQASSTATAPPSSTPTSSPTESPTASPTESPTASPTTPPSPGQTGPPPPFLSGVDTDLTASTAAIDFGAVAAGSTSASAPVILTNNGGDPFGPINIFGGAPPTAEFNASQNCQATTLPAGGSCMVNFTFTPGAAGTYNDTSSFTVSETASQSDGEDFSVTLTGTGT